MGIARVHPQQPKPIAPAQPPGSFPSKSLLQHLRDWLSYEYHGTMEWMAKNPERRADLQKVLPECRSIICVGINYWTDHNPNEAPGFGRIARYAWGKDYHHILKKRLKGLERSIAKLAPKATTRSYVDTGPVMEKVWAQKAGLGWQGKHTNLISRDYGSWFFLGELIVDITLDYDEPFSEDLCGTCTACIDTCPTQALEDYKIDSGKCISYLTIEHRGDFPEGRDDLHGWIYGCDICQEVCPWNEKFGKSTTDPAFQPRPEIIDFSDKDWNAMDEDSFRKLFKGSAVKRTKYSGLKRNIVNNQH